MKNIRILRFLIIISITVSTLITQGQTENSKSYKGRIPEFYFNNEEVKKSVTKIAELITDNRAVLYRLRLQPTKVYHTWGSGKNIRVLEDRIEFTKNKETAVVYFKDIINDFFSSDYDGSTRIYIGEFLIKIKGKEPGQKLKDEFHSLREKNKNMLIEDRKSQLILFEKTAAEYRSLKVKPPVSEEQRKYIVQANAFNEKKLYHEAIRLYNQAIGLDQTAYPAAYSNLALLSAQVKQYSDAIFYMKKYLLLEPEATDTRGAQDKIYEWEGEIAK